MIAWLQRLLALFVIFAVSLCAQTRAQDWPTLRRTNYAAILGSAGKELKLQLRSQQHVRQYGDELSYTLVGPDSNEIASGGIPLDTTKTIVASPKADGLCVLEMDSGWNICFLDSGESPSAYIASETMPLHTIREIERLYFYVPKGRKQFAILVTADVTHEAARIILFSPDGQVVKEDEGDYDTQTRIKVNVPAGADGKVWSLSVAKPKAAGLVLDDVTLSLDSSLPPYLSKRPDWALMFGKRRHE
jgi:hypothetical protein